MTAWIYLAIAGVFEIVWAVGLKYTHGFTRLWPSVWVFCAMALSIAFLSQAIKTLPVGTAYAVWTGIGAAGTAVIGILFLGEPVHLMRVASLFLIIAGVVGLKLYS